MPNKPIFCTSMCIIIVIQSAMFTDVVCSDVHTDALVGVLLMCSPPLIYKNSLFTKLCESTLESKKIDLCVLPIDRTLKVKIFNSVQVLNHLSSGYNLKI